MSFLPKPELNTANTNTHTHIRLVCGASYCGHGTVKCSGYDDDDAEAATGWWWSTEQRKRIMVKCMQRPMHRQECAVVMCEFFLTLLSLSLSLSLSIYLSWKRMLMWIIMFVPKTLYCCCCYARRCAPFFSSLWNANFCVHLFFTSKWAQNKYWSVLCACTECIFAYIYSSCISTVNSSTAESKHDQRKATHKKKHMKKQRTHGIQENKQQQQQSVR